MSSYLHNTPARPRAVATSFSISNLLFWGVLPVLLLMSSEVWGQATGDYRSRQSGNWSDGSTWERYNGSAWVAQNTFPEVAGTASSAKTVVTGTTHTVSLPSGIQSGDLLLIFWADAEDLPTVPTTPSGWTQLYTNTHGNKIRSAWYKVATGLEGATIDITAAAERSAHNAYRISTGTYQGVPVAATADVGNNMTPDPPSLTSGFGATNTLWIAAAHAPGDGNTLTNPANYSDQISGYSSAAGNAHALMISARRELSVATEDPGTFSSYSTNRRWAACTVSIQSSEVGPPSSTSGAITIQNGHNVTVSTAVNADQCTIEAGGQVTVNSGQTWTIADGAGTDLTVNGDVVNSGTVTMTGTAAFEAGSIYEHALNGGAIPLAAWNITSNCIITGVVNTMPSNNVQNFGNFTWNCVNQSSNCQFSNTFSIQGNLTVISTNADELRFSNDKANVVSGNYNQSGGTVGLRNNNTHSLTVMGNFSLSGGTFIKQGDNTPGGILNIGGDFSLTTGGTLNGGMLLNVYFNGTTSQSFTSGGTVSGTVNYTVNANAILQMNTATTVVTGTSFTLSSGATLGITSSNGITTDACGTGATCGNIRTTTRTFNAAANYLYNGTAAQNTGNGLPAILTGELEIDNPAGVSLSAAQTINTPGTLLLTDGNLTTTTTNLLTLGNDVTVTPNGGSATSFVHGPVRKVGNDAFTFPIGKNDIHAPISISAPGATSDSYQAEYFAAAPTGNLDMVGILAISSQEYWDLDKIAGTSVNVILNFTGNSMATMPDLSNLRVARYNESLMPPRWVSEGNTATSGTETTSGTITSGAVSSFSFFTLGSSVAMNALPIELAFFTATPQNKTVQLNWRTTTELNNAFFHVERSVNCRDFVEIGKIAGAGTSQQPLDYAFTDQLPLNGWNYYRLRQVDFDGTFSFSPVQAVLMDKTGVATRLLLFPNPASTELNLKTDLLTAPGDQLELLDHTGRLMQRFSASDALNGPMDISQLPAGTYIARLRTASGFVNAAFVKQ